MKFTLSWLKTYLDTTASLEAITTTLTNIGLEVEHIANPAEKLKGFVIARIVEAVQHPNADRLRLCTVDYGAAETMQVVCGAPNAAKGLVSVFAPVGTYIPGKNITLTKGVIRGVESCGMLCSAAELELSEDHDGIIALPHDAPVGQSYTTYAKLDDPVIDINLTPNRADAASVYGIARDLAAAGLGTLKSPAIAPIPSTSTGTPNVVLDLAPEDAHLCPLFALRLVKDVKNPQAPDWLQTRLRSTNHKVISTLVDITNFMTFDRGRPLHVFDAAKISGTLVVRRAKDGETFEALDGKTYTLSSDMVVIADDNGVQSLAGVMGGAASGVSENTTDVLIESALWDPHTIAKTGRALGIVSDARYRFERGVDPDFCLPGLELATQMVLDLCGGVACAPIIAGAVPDSRKSFAFAPTQLARLTGKALSTDTITTIFQKLGFDVTPGKTPDSLSVTVPGYRPDITRHEQLVEEIVRIHGLEKFAPTPLPLPVSETGAPLLPPEPNLKLKRIKTARYALASRGFVEAITWSFIAGEQAALFGGGSDDLKLSNPIASDLSHMRPSLLPGLLLACGRNARRGIADIALCEIGQIFLGRGETDQRIAIAGVRRGTARYQGFGRDWRNGSANVAMVEAKADALAVLDALGIAVGGLQLVRSGADYPAWLHPGQSARMQFGPKGVIGHFGTFHPSVLEALDVTGPLVGFELILEALPAPKQKATKAKAKLALSQLMPIERDFAFFVPENTPAQELLKAAQTADRALIETVTLFDVFTGKGVPEGQKSMAFSVRIQPQDKTLTDEEIDGLSAKIIAGVQKATGGVLRG